MKINAKVTDVVFSIHRGVLDRKYVKWDELEVSMRIFEWNEDRIPSLVNKEGGWLSLFWKFFLGFISLDLS